MYAYLYPYVVFLCIYQCVYVYSICMCVYMYLRVYISMHTSMYVHGRRAINNITQTYTQTHTPKQHHTSAHKFTRSHVTKPIALARLLGSGDFNGRQIAIPRRPTGGGEADGDRSAFVEEGVCPLVFIFLNVLVLFSHFIF